MLQQPRISIIMPVYNVREYIEETIDSLLNQTIGMEHLEYIFVNDGSSDGSEKIIDEYASKYNNIKAIHLKNSSGAAGKPRNIGMEHIHGEYIMFVDPDDICLPEACETLYEVAEKYESEIVVGIFSSFSQHDENNHLFEDYDPLFNQSVVDYPFLLQIPNNLNAKLYQTKYIKKNNILFPEGVASQDAVFTTKAYLLSDKISFIPKNIFKYRIRTDKENPSITQNRNVKYFQDFSSIRKSIIQLYKDYSQLDYFNIRYFNDIRWLLYQLEYVNKDISVEEKIDILSGIQWFLELAEIHKVDMEDLPANRKDFYTKILRKDYEGAISYMNGEVHNLFKDI